MAFEYLFVIIKAMKKIMIGSLIVLSLIFLTFALPESVLSQSIPFETIDMGEVSYFRYEDSLFQGAELVIRDIASWESFWRLHSQGMNPPPPLPKVTFQKEMILAVILGNQGSGGGPRIEITSMDEWPINPPDSVNPALKKITMKGIRVTVKDSREPGPLTAITNPYHIVKVKNYSSVIFEHLPFDIPCQDNAPCGKEEFCEKKTGDCDGAGVCIKRPESCPLYFIYDPVCGCDGKTYDSECAAAMEGVSVLHKGRCEIIKCQNKEDCLIKEFCLFPEGTCSLPGACTPKPDICTMIYDPVCGCDGVTYGNSCEALAAGASILHQGSCL